ncbi:response regulator [Mucilaginibacter sp. McL0603]|uniref:response regulator n=1 Tax=Mucilaginibacter sp. McL0603 TaxID=3415670 RepID=UPI003CE78DAD
MNTQSPILLIDDERRSGGWLGRILRLAGYTCRQAESGSEGIRLLEREKIQVVMSDVDLPDMDFTDFVKTVKKKKPFVEVILLTTHPSVFEAIRAIKSGACDYLVKGRDNDVILTVLAQAKEKARIFAQ